jgi:hypothetical protein
MARYSLEIPKESDLHKRLIKKIDSRIQLAKREQQTRHENWRKAENSTLAYIPESEADAVRRSSRDNDGEPRYTTIQIPYTYAVLMSAHTYWTSVFFARSPIHQFNGRHGEGEMQVQAMEALIGYQVEVGGAVGPYYIWLYDAGKYGLGILGTYWCREKLHFGELVEMDDPTTPGKTAIFQTTQEIDGYIGNKTFNVSPWDFFPDPRVPVKNFQNGEFCANLCRLGWHQILQRQASGYYNKNVDRLKDHTSTDKSNASSSALERPSFTKSLYEDETEVTKHPAGAIFYEFYVDLIPSEWGVGNTNYPQKWCFTITEDCGLIVGASPLGHLHCKFPFDVLESEVEGYGTFARGTPEILEPVQNTIDWLVNTHFFNVRQTLNNQFIVDPSKLVVKDVQRGGPGFIWRLRPEAYGSDLDKIFKQVPVTDVTRSHMADFQAMLGLGERITGVNDQIMGALQTGSNRKTATEVRTTTSFGVNRQKTTTEYMSATGFAPHAQKLVQNSQQFYDVTAKLRRVGSFAVDAGEMFLNVSPQDIMGFYDLAPVDGALPVDKMAQANLWKEIMAGIRMMPPQVAMEYDWSRIFAWVANLGGIKNIQQFRIKVVPDAQVQEQAAAGNVIPMRPGAGLAPGATSSTVSGLNAMGAEGGGPIL